ncbi:hypothetical protein HYPSUDRAFT_204575 [Hypholoma sublateritium FD-334 SS-4]|uniref:Uncharacterized protein n=1 Tax=Hypholoma sublateritium (strain FD-334 SS-4) TaxID=945553 RepID=A0A0D2M893_HYPSF|nr:hypothetical protein HYPSUDRAFT_204575 [Hypholoma sublateritium FD-334 SS-4]
MASVPTTADKLTPKQRAELIKNSQSNIKCKPSAKAWMTENGYITDGEPITTTTIAAALLLMTTCKFPNPSLWIDGMRAAAICIDNIQHEEAIKTITEEATARINEITNQLTQNLTELVDTTNQKILQENEKRRNEANEAEKQRQEADKAREDWLEKVKEMTLPPQRIDNEEQKKSYADTLATIFNTTSQPSTAATTNKTESDIRREQDICAREEKRSKQILIDGLANILGRNATPEEVLAKVNEAWTAIPEVIIDEECEYDSYEKPEAVKFITARLLTNGGVILEINSIYGAIHLRNPAVRKEFQKTLGKDVSIKDRQYTILVEFLPVTLQQRLTNMASIIEEDNLYQTGDIHQIRWMRDPDNNWRKEQQTTIHTTHAPAPKNTKSTTTKSNRDQQTSTIGNSKEIRIQTKVNKRKEHDTKERLGPRTKQNITHAPNHTIGMGQH